MIEPVKFVVSETPVHLGLGARVIRHEPLSNDSEWYEHYAQRHGADGVECRLVMMHTFDEPWSTWEMHPLGDELVLCLSGSMTVLQETANGQRKVTLLAGEAIINEPGVWHTADANAPVTALYITAGTGTQLRPR